MRGLDLFNTSHMRSLMKIFFKQVLSRLSFISALAQMTRVSPQFEKSKEGKEPRLAHPSQVRCSPICSYLDGSFSCFEFWKENAGILLSLYLTLLGGKERIVVVFLFCLDFQFFLLQLIKSYILMNLYLLFSSLSFDSLGCFVLLIHL